MKPLRKNFIPSLLSILVFAVSVQSQGTSLKINTIGDKSTLSSNDAIIHTTGQEIRDAKLFGDQDVNVAGWLQNNQHWYSIKLENGKWSSAKRTETRIRLRMASFDPLVDAPEFVNADFSDPSDNKNKLFLVQFKTQSLPFYKKEMANLGAKVYRYVPNNAYIVRMNAATALETKKLPFVRWVGQFSRNLKSDTEVSDTVLATDSQSLESYVIVLTDKADRENVLAEVSSTGGEIVSRNQGSHLIEARINSFGFYHLSGLAEVLWLEPAGVIEEDVDNARIQGGTNALEENGQDEQFTGIGIRGHVLEGIYKDHEDFEANDHRKKPIGVDSTNPAGHGQATYGIIFGSGKGKAEARGFLPNAQGYFTNYRAVFSSEAGTKEVGGRYELVKRLVEEHNVMFQTASWGYPRTKEYNARSLEMDELIFAHDIPITQSQSNAGTQNSRPQAWAKNIISVGALKHFDNADPTDDKWQRGASIGPAADGRIKPDLSAFYDKILTTSSSGYTQTFGGTSGATPIVAGHVGLTIEMWTDAIFRNELPKPEGSRFDNRPHFTTVKALLINQARQYKFEGTADDRTRVHQGWGFPNVINMYNNRDKMLIVNETEALKATETSSYEVDVTTGTPELKVTMVYSDPAGTVGAEITRVNNLDLKVTDPDGNIYWGNHGLLESMYSKTGGQANKVDTVENVFVKEPAVGTWKVEVIADEINQDAHLETEDEDADYALVVSGIKK